MILKGEHDHTTDQGNPAHPSSLLHRSLNSSYKAPLLSMCRLWILKITAWADQLTVLAQSKQSKESITFTAKLWVDLTPGMVQQEPQLMQNRQHA